MLKINQLHASEFGDRACNHHHKKKVWHYVKTVFTIWFFGTTREQVKKLFLLFLLESRHRVHLTRQTTCSSRQLSPSERPQTLWWLACPSWCDPSWRHLTGLLGCDVARAQLGEEGWQPVLCFSGCLRVQPGQALLQQMILQTQDRWTFLLSLPTAFWWLLLVWAGKEMSRNALTRTWQARSFSHLRPALISLTVT